MNALTEFWANHSLLVLDIIGTLVGLWYLWLEYRGSITLWLVGIIMPAIYIFTYYKAGLYADFGLQIYYLIAAVFGWFAWKFNRKQKEQEMPITHISIRTFSICMLVFLCVWVLVYWILIRFTNSNVPLCDSFVNSLSFIALWMLSRKYAEQWFLWFVVDAFCAALYVYKDIPFTACLYGIYTVIAIFGYFKWVKLMKAYAQS